MLGRKAVSLLPKDTPGPLLAVLQGRLRSCSQVVPAQSFGCRVMFASRLRMWPVFRKLLCRNYNIHAQQAPHREAQSYKLGNPQSLVMGGLYILLCMRVSLSCTPRTCVDSSRPCVSLFLEHFLCQKPMQKGLGLFHLSS